MDAFIRGAQLRDLRRLEEAVAEFKRHLAEHPNDAEGHAQLAVTYLQMAGERKGALESINAAIGLAPTMATYPAYKALILTNLSRYRDSVKAADDAIALDPDLSLAWVAKSGALISLEKWDEAERVLMRALEIDPDDEIAQDKLVMVRRFQGRTEEAEAGANRALERNPESPTAHANMGWSALRRHDHKEAEKHFREALRLDPESEYARLGLRESFKARSGFYRLFLRWAFAMQKFSQGQRWLIIIGLYLAFRFGSAVAKQIHPGLMIAVVILYLTLAFGTILSSGLSHFFLLKDRNARLSLNRQEKLDGFFVGGGFLGGIVLVVLGAVMGSLGGLGVSLFGAALSLGAVPAALVFTNESKQGRLLFGAFLLLIYSTGVFCLVQGIGGGNPLAEPADSMALYSLFAVVLTSWLGNVSALRN